MTGLAQPRSRSRPLPVWSAERNRFGLAGLPVVWWCRARFRSQLLDVLDGPDYLLDDVGFDRWAARAEAARRFWQPVAMRCGPWTSQALRAGRQVGPGAGGMPPT